MKEEQCGISFLPRTSQEHWTDSKLRSHRYTRKMAVSASSLSSFQGLSILSSSWKMVPLLLSFMMLLVFALDVQADDDVQNFLNSMDQSNKQKLAGKEPLSLMWGIGDTSAIVGKLFSYSIPNDAFKGKVQSFKVSEAGSRKLPGWLSFDKSQQQFQGVPLPGDIGQYYVEVVAVGSNENSTPTEKTKDVFAINVLKETTSVTGASPLRFSSKTIAPTVKCKRGDPETLFTLIVDADLEQMDPASRIKLLMDLEQNLQLASEMFSMKPVGSKKMFDDSALVNGPGNIKTPKHLGTFVSWLVGCGKVEPDHMHVLQNIEASSANGSIAEAIGHSIVGWHVTNKLTPEKRFRRQAPIRATPTPVMTVGPPTHLVSVPAVTVKHTDQPMTHVMPTAEPPATIQPTKTHRHMKTTGRPSHETKTATVRPTQAQPTASSIMPTKAFSIAPTIMHPDVGVTEMYIPPTRTGIIIEPSVLFVSSTTMVKTKPLPVTTTYSMTSKEVITTFATPPMVPPTSRVTTTSTTAATTTTGKMQKTTSKPPKHPLCKSSESGPIVQHDISNIDHEAGKMFRMKIDKNVFSDCAGGDTRDLKLFLFRNYYMEVPSSLWLHFDTSKQLITGLPLEMDVGEYNLTLTAEDTNARVAKTSFLIIVNKSALKITHEFELTFDMDYKGFMSNVSHRVSIIRKIAKLYGDKNPHKITVTKIKEGSVVFSWTNNTLEGDKCPSGIEDVRSRLINENKSLTTKAKEIMKPYKLQKAMFFPQGPCKSGVTNTGTTTMTELLTNKTKPARESDDDDIWITTVVPAVVIVAILLLALLIGCILYRKKRKGKMSLEEQPPYTGKGPAPPVIFQDELEEKPSDSSRPLILEEEKPPQPPPEYHRSSSESAQSTPHSNHKVTGGMDVDEDEHDVTSPLYQPPPPVTASQGNKQPRPHVQPPYRNPPPYVPP